MMRTGDVVGLFQAAAEQITAGAPAAQAGLATLAAIAASGDEHDRRMVASWLAACLDSPDFRAGGPTGRAYAAALLDQLRGRPTTCRGRRAGPRVPPSNPPAPNPPAPTVHACDGDCGCRCGKPCANCRHCPCHGR